MKLTLLITLCFVSTSFALELFGRDQSCAVRGKLVCDSKPAVGVKVKLWDEDDTDSDDLLDESRTDSNGEFHLAGWTKEYTPIDPKLNIYHDCNDMLPCQRKFTIKIENKYISDGKNPRSVYDAGVIQLAGVYPGESRDCIN
ncbi:unnamed protein product [Auanema sp. JU1783]|nr:unnamed protein product [Auanema sp. JU1783]